MNNPHLRQGAVNVIFEHTAMNSAPHSGAGIHTYGKANMIKFGDGMLKLGYEDISSDYEDDTCFFVGSRKIYFRRHIIRSQQAFLQQWKPMDPWKISDN